jgi:hypothetical protein
MDVSQMDSNVGCGVVWCGVVWCGVVWCGVCLGTHSVSLACLPASWSTQQFNQVISSLPHMGPLVHQLSSIPLTRECKFKIVLWKENVQWEFPSKCNKQIFNDSTPHADLISPKTVNPTNTMYFMLPILQKDLEIQTSLDTSWILLGFVSRTSLVPV